MNVDCGRRTCCVVYGTQERKKEKKKKKKKWIFIIRKQNSSLRNLYSNSDFLIIQKNLGGLAAMTLYSITYFSLVSVLVNVLFQLVQAPERFPAGRVIDQDETL